MFLTAYVILLLKGFVRLQVKGGSCERFLNLCGNHGIFIWELCPTEKGYEMNLLQRDVYRLKPLAKKCHTRIRIIQKYGLPFFINRHRKRKVFALGIFCCGFFIYVLSCFIWNIEISGNRSVSRPVLMEYLSAHAAGYGAKKDQIDCKAMAADLRAAFPDFTWVSVKMEGTGLIVEVQENTDVTLYEKRVYEDSDLLSDVDGTVVSIITRQGTPCVKEGDQVEKGTLLVSGSLPITDDGDAVIAYQYCAADADIYVRTEVPYHDDIPLEFLQSAYTGAKRYGAFFKIGGRCFGMMPGKRRHAEEDFLKKEHTLRLFDDFYLPFSVGVVTARAYKNELHSYTKEEARALAEEKLQKFLYQNEEKGVQISEKNVKIDISATSCHADGTITVIKKAGKRVRTEKTDPKQE